MADITKRGPDCDDDGEGERGERGERGKRGKRGHRGHDGERGDRGSDGATGPTGPSGDGTIAVADDGVGLGNFSLLNFAGEGVTVSDAGGGVANITIAGDSALDAAIGLAYVYRPGATGADAPGGNVFTEWEPLMAAIDSTRELGVRTLEFDNSFSTHPGHFFPEAGPACPIPAGVWNMTGVKWVNIPRELVVEVELLDGAQIVIDQDGTASAAGNLRALQLEGYGLVIVSNRTGPVAPFFDVSILAGGNNVRFANTDPAALPMFEVGPDGFAEYLFSGENANGGFGFFGPSPKPLVDLKGGAAFLGAFAGTIENNVFTDTVGGGGVFVAGLFDELRTDPINAWDNPALFAAGGFVAADDVRAQVRYRLDPNFVLLTGVVTPVDSPYAASYNEFVPVDTSVGPVTVNLPNADRAEGDRVTVKDVGGTAGTNNITIGSAFGNFIESPVVADDIGEDPTVGGSKTWVSDGRGNWWLVAQV